MFFFLYELFLFSIFVCTGHGSKEQLPMVIRVPKIIKTALSICERPYSLLGFGDILLPGKNRSRVTMGGHLLSGPAILGEILFFFRLLSLFISGLFMML